MSRVPVLLVAVAASILLGLTPTPAQAVEQIEIDPTLIQVDIESQDVEQTRADGNDGSYVIGGHIGAQPECPGVQAFVKRFLPNGNTAWELSASANKDCDGDGQPDGGGDPLFADMTNLDSDYIQSSSIYDAIYLPDKTSFVTGQLLLSWDDEDVGVTAAWGAFVLHRAANGDHIADLYVGPQPNGPAVDIATCEAACSALSNNELVQWGGRALAWFEDETDTPNGLMLAGWRQSVDDQNINGKDIFLVALTLDLETAKWFRLLPSPGADQPLAVAIGHTGDVYATGFYGSDHDVFVACFDGHDGTLTHLFRGGGPDDDWGETLEITTDGEIMIEGKFTDTASFEGQTLEGNGLTDFRALLTPTLEPILIEVIGGEERNGGATAAPEAPLKRLNEIPNQLPDDPFDTHDNVPNKIEVRVGWAGTGTHASLVASPDDGKLLYLYGEERPDSKKVEVVFDVPISQGAQRLKSVKVLIQSNFCTDLTVLLGGGDAAPDDFYNIGNTEICALDKVMVTVEIPSEIAEQQLGFTASSQPSAPLQVLLSMDIHGHPLCSTCLSGDDEEVDALMVDSEDYP